MSLCTCSFRVYKTVLSLVCRQCVNVNVTSLCAHRLCVSIYIYQYIQVSSVLKYFNITSSTNNLFRLSYTYGGVCVPSPPLHRPSPSLSFKYPCMRRKSHPARIHTHTHTHTLPFTLLYFRSLSVMQHAYALHLLVLSPFSSY